MWPRGPRGTIAGVEDRQPPDREIERLIAGIFAAAPPPRASALDVLAGLAEAVGTLRRAERGWLEAARDQGCSWTEIGGALGISRQAARKRLAARHDR